MVASGRPVPSWFVDKRGLFVPQNSISHNLTRLESSSGGVSDDLASRMVRSF